MTKLPLASSILQVFSGSRRNNSIRFLEENLYLADGVVLNFFSSTPQNSISQNRINRRINESVQKLAFTQL